MEIKQGDKVRVSEDVPRYIVGSANDIDSRAVVFSVDADIATIGFRTEEKQQYDAYKIPTKYLIKVGAEAKEPKFKVGDMVKIHHRVPYWGHNGKVGRVNFITKDGKYCIFGVPCEWDEGNLEPYAEPTGQTEADKSDTDNLINEMGNVIESYRKAFADIADSFYWATYERELAHDIAVAYAEKGRYEPQEIGEKAAVAAKSVVENLKKK